MKKIFVVGALALMVSNSTFAGGLLTNTNQNAAFLRNPARDAVIAIDGVYSNPAGIAFLPQGFHLSISWQAAFQKRQMDVTNSLFGMNADGLGTSRTFEGKATAPVIPSFQAAYVINDKWSLSAQFAVGGGGGKCEFEEGLPMFEELIGGTLYSAKAQSYSLNQNLTGEQYFYGLQVGGTYKVTENFSVFGGVRTVLASCSYVGAINNIKASGALTQGASVSGAEYLNAVSQYMGAMGDQASATTAAMGAALMSQDFNLDCSQSGVGFTPIIGVDWKLGKLNLAAKYEFRTKINLENESHNSENVDALMSAYKDGAKVRSDIPALFTVGAQYSALPSLRISAGYHLYVDKDAAGSATAVSNNTWEATLGVEWDVNDKLLLSCGSQRTKYGFEDNEMQDTNFNISSYALCIGGAYKINSKMKVNVGYMHSFYDNHKFTNANGTACDYTRKNDVVGASLDITF